MISRYSKDINAIFLYLIKEEWTHIAMLANEVNTAAQELFKIVCSSAEVIGIGRHDDENIHIAAFVMLIASYRTENSHVGYAKFVGQFLRLTSQDIYILLPGFHVGKVMPFS